MEDAPRLKEPPQSIDAEESLLSGAMRHRDGYADASFIRTAHFHKPAHRLIWRAIGDVAKSGALPEPGLVLEALGSNRDKAGGKEYLLDVYGAACAPENVEAYARIVVAKHGERQRINDANALADAAFDGDRAAMDDAQRRIAENGYDPEQRRLRTADEIQPQGTVWMWDRWLPHASFVLFAAPGGSGKGTFWSYLVACVTNEKRWPNGKVTDPKNVAIYSPEDDPARELVPRLMLAGADMSRVFLMDSPADLDRLPEDVALVVLDPIASGFGGDGNANTDVRPYLEPFNAYAEKTGATILGVHHVGKYASTKHGAAARDLPLGSTAWVDIARWLLMLARDRSDPEGSRILIRAKGNLGGVDYSQGAWRIHADEGDLGTDEAGRPIRNRYVSRMDYIEGDADELFFGALAPPSRDEDTGENDSATTIMEVLEQLGGTALRTELVREVANHGIAGRTFDKWIKRLADDGKLEWRNASAIERPEGVRSMKIAVLNRNEEAPWR